MKKIATTFGAVALLAAAVIPAFGAGNSCMNGTTGPSSNNTCSINNTTNVSVNNVNDAKIVNDIRTVSNTGGNSASNNTLGGNITTGNASLNATLSSVANVNTTNISVGWAGSNNAGANNVTGPSSNNTAYINNAHRVDVYNSNTATVDNAVNSTADTGSNNADNNTGPAYIRTGSSNLATSVFSHVNDSLTAISLGSGGTGNNTAGNDTTGPFSYNMAVINNAVDVGVNNVNDLQVRNRVDVFSSTGSNSASNNTLGGDILTGNASAGVNVGTEGNINTTQIAAAMGGFNNIAGSAVTGPGSVNDSYINNERSVVYDNWNNKCESHNADDRHWGRFGDASVEVGPGPGPGPRPECNVNNLGVENDVESISDAGNSYADNNTGGGSVVAGWSSLMQSVMTHLNDVLNDIVL